MSLKQKAALLDLSDLDEPVAEGGSETQASPAATSPDPTPDGSLRRARSGVAAITESISKNHLLQDLQERVNEYEQGGVVVSLDPKKVRPSRYKNRDSRSFTGKKFQDLKAEIAEAGRNVQPIKVRRLAEPDADGYEYEIAYGRRRHRCCLELGLPVQAIVASLTDHELFQEMERENRYQEDLTPWERGTMYKDALDTGLYASQRQLAAALGVDQGNLSKALALASLPAPIIEAFESPLDLQYRWGTELSQALDKDAQGVLTAAEAIKAEAPRPPAAQVLARLLGSAKATQTSVRSFAPAGKEVASWTSEKRGGRLLKIKAGAINPSQEKRLLEFLEKLFS